jgi:hypothetical protein
MATTNRRQTASTPARVPRDRQAITLELVTRIAPSAAQAEKIATRYALDPVDYHAIREATEEQFGVSAKALQEHPNEVALRIHLQRIVGAFVASAHGAANFYNQKVTYVRDLATKLQNEDRDEDRGGVYGFESRVERAQNFTAEAGLTAYALLAVAEGAVDAYAEIVGEDWKPYVADTAPHGVSGQAVVARMEAFD